MNDLQKKFSVDTIMSDLGDMVRGQAGDLGHSISHTVGRNPAAVALVGVGLAWLFLGQDRNRANGASERQSGQGSGRGRGRAAHNQWDDNSMLRDRSDDGSSFDDESRWYGDTAASRTFRGSESLGGSQKPSSSNDPSHGMMDKVRNAATAAGEAASDAASAVGHAASDITERLSAGLDDLSEEARARVLSARRAAHEARISSQQSMQRGSQAASHFFEEQPLVVGALAVALGAAIGGVLPHSKIEDDTMGDSSDRLFADAQALFREERDKAVAAARNAASALKSEARDVGSDLQDLLPEDKNVGDVIVDRASDAATRVLDRATGQNEHQERDGPKN
jgi:hypothetical protein